MHEFEYGWANAALPRAAKASQAPHPAEPPRDGIDRHKQPDTGSAILRLVVPPDLPPDLPAEDAAQTPAIATFNWPAIARRLKLSPQQTQIAQHFLRDESLDAIAKLLGCEVSSVKTQIARMYRKHGIRSRAAMCSLVYETAIQMMREGGGQGPTNDR